LILFYFILLALPWRQLKKEKEKKRKSSSS
jgi:hypothetical protein